MMTNEALAVDALVFDVFGTLFDHDSAVAEVEADLGADASRLAELWRHKQLQYSWLRTLMHRPADFRTVTGDGLDYALAALGLPAEARAPLMDSYRRLRLFPEVPEVLDRLVRDGRRLALLSNGSRSMLEAVVEAGGLGDRFEALFSAETANVFKPHPLVYQLAVDGFGLPRERIALVSSNSWDAVGAAAFGMKAIWVNRKNEPAERLPASPDRIVSTLAEVPGLLA